MNVWQGSLLSFFGLSSEGRDPIHNFWYGDVSPRTAGGIAVNESTAMTYSVCWAATRLIAGTASWIPLNLYRRLPDGGAEIDTNHRVHSLIHDSPNNDMSSMMWRATGFNQQVNRGNAFAEIVRNRAGEAVALEPIHAERIPPRNIRRENGKLVYYVRNYNPNGRLSTGTTRIKQEDMFHVPSIVTEDGIIGKGVVTAAREAIGKAMGTQKRGASSINSGGTPPLAIKGGKFRTKDDREEYRRQFAEAHSGPDNVGKPLLLPENSEAQILGFNLKDMQFIESQQFDIEEICRWYGVPPHLVGHLLRATFNNIEELGISFVKYSQILWLKIWEQEIWRKLLTKAERRTHYAKFVVDALERGNLKNRTDSSVKQFFNGLLTLNEWAKREDMNPIGPLGNLHFVQKAMVPLEVAAKGPQEQGKRKGSENPPPPSQERSDDESGGDKRDQQTSDPEGDMHARLSQSLNDLAKNFDTAMTAATETINRTTQQTIGALATVDARLTALRQVQIQTARAHLSDVFGRMLSIETHAVKHIAEKPSRFDQRLNEFYSEHSQTLTRNLTTPVSVLLGAFGDEREAEQVTSQLVASHTSKSMRQLIELTDCKTDELSGRVDECLSTWRHDRLPEFLAAITQEPAPCN